MVVSAFAHPLHDFSLPRSSLSFLLRSLSLSFSLAFIVARSIYFLNPTLEKESCTFGQYEGKKEKGEQKNYSIVADHYMYTIVLCPAK
jgi:hypothetical protein